MGRIRRLAAMVAVLTISTAGWSVAASAAPRRDVRTPTVSGPVTAGRGVNLIGPDVSSLGYAREEFFLEGDATAYEPVGRLDSEGKWRVKQSGTEPFKTRMVVWKPADPADFNGTVFVEWLNVSPGFDNPPDWLSAHNQIVREGAVWVGVSAQQASVSGGANVIQAEGAPPPGGLKAADPQRYGSLEHPGDEFSFDIFTQGGMAVRDDSDGPNPLSGYDVESVIAMGESQSAYRMTTYVNAVHPLTRVFDGFLIHSRGGESAPFGAQQLGQDNPDIPNNVKIRRDLDAPVLTFETEGDLIVLGFTPARQHDSKSFRLWEAAGTSHADTYFALSLGDLGDGTAEAAMLDPANATGGRLNCTTPNNAGGQHALVMAALAALEKWVRDGTAPPKAPRIKTTSSGEVVRDEHGIARGGIRTPLVDVPVATNDGEEGSGPTFCRLFGHMKPFDAETIAELYPNGEADYVKAFDEAADRAVEAGFWLRPEAEHYKAAARQLGFD